MKMIKCRKYVRYCCKSIAVYNLPNTNTNESPTDRKLDVLWLISLTKIRTHASV